MDNKKRAQRKVQKMIYASKPDLLVDEVFKLQDTIEEMRGAKAPEVKVEAPKNEPLDYIGLAGAVVDHIKNLKGNDRIDISHIRNGERIAQLANKKLDFSDMRWHGSGSASSVTSVYNETPSGLVNGINTVFTLLFVPTTNTLRLFAGQRQTINQDFTLSGLTITFLIAPMPGTNLLADYNH